MDEARKDHRLLLEPVDSTRSLLGGPADLYAAACSAGDWMDPRPYADYAHHESFDEHMAGVQQKIHQETTAAGPKHIDRPDEQA